LSRIGVSIIGGSGYTGAELIRLLVRHEKVEILHVTSRELSGTPVEARLPNLSGIDLKYEMPDPDGYGDSEIVFLCIGHTFAMGMVPQILENSRVVDFSADYRLLDRDLYEKVYDVKHTSPEMEAVYGLPELHGAQVADARLVANPGCYPTGAILALAPLVKAGVIDFERIVIDSKSGTSGAGIKATMTTHHPECAGSVKPYRVTDHRHVPEINQELGLLAGRELTVNFTPHLIPISRGILTTCHVFPVSPLNEDDCRSLYSSFYARAPFVRMREEVPDLRGVIGSNFCDIGIEIDRATGRLVVVSAIDNLTKGASGQAVQNMNLMLRIGETMGLELPGLYP
jgi:N-acetyl-gamma-glutamyl-phosphate reductase